MTAPGSAPRRPSRAELSVYRDLQQRADGADDRRLRGAVGQVLGMCVGALAGVALIPVSLLLFVNSVVAVGVLLAATLAGGSFGRRRAQLGDDARSELRLEESLADQNVIDRHELALAAIRREAATLREVGVERPEIAARALQQVDAANQAYRAHFESRGTARLPEPSAPEAPVRQAPLLTPIAPPAPLAASAPSGAPAPSPAASVVHSSLPRAGGLPGELVVAKRNGSLVPFVGAGLSRGNDVRGNFPGWSDLPRRLLDEVRAHRWNDADDRRTMRERFLAIDPADPGREVARSKDLQEFLLELDTVKGKLGTDYANALSAIFLPQDAAPGAAHRAIMAMGAPFVLTTNYDQLLEAVEGPPTRQVYTWRQAHRAHADVKQGRRVLFKVHGSADDEASIVLTASEYREASKDPAYRLVVHYLLAGHTFLFVGYGMSDPADLDLILKENAAALQGGSQHFALLQRVQADVRRQQLQRDHNIATIPFDDYEEIVPFLEALASA